MMKQNPNKQSSGWVIRTSTQANDADKALLKPQKMVMSDGDQDVNQCEKPVNSLEFDLGLESNE